MKSELKNIYTHIDARDRIIAAALEVFSDLGFAGASMRTIAEKADVSAALIHHHFKDKETLWKIVEDRITAEFHDAVSVGTDSGNLKQDYLSLMRNFQRYWLSHPHAAKLQLWRLLRSSEEERQKRTKNLNKYFVPKIAEAQKNGFIRDDIPTGLAMLTYGGLILFFLHNRLEFDSAVKAGGAKPLSDDDIFNYLIDLIAPQQGKTSKNNS